MAQFQVFTYQFREFKTTQLDLFEENAAIDTSESMAHKQELFEAAWKDKEPLVFKYKGVEYKHRVLEIRDHIIVFRIANNKKVKREQDFQVEMLDDKPSCMVVIDNRHDRQQIAIQKNRAFSKQAKVADIIQWTFCELLEKHGLKVEIKARYSATEFWMIVHDNPVGVAYLKFTFTPKNLPWLAGKVKRFFNEVGDHFDADPALELRSGEDGGKLAISEEDSVLGDLLDVSAASGMPIKMRLVGFAQTMTCGRRTSITVSMSDSIMRELSDPQRGVQYSTTDYTWDGVVQFVNEIKILYKSDDDSCSEGSTI